ncbi:MAG: hypothetical protein MJZ35_06280 [Bacteroidaceae bacterium]|nr:hypothetical protein [Bacteroidaceae bacterium]
MKKHSKLIILSLFVLPTFVTGTRCAAQTGTTEQNTSSSNQMYQDFIRDMLSGTDVVGGHECVDLGLPSGTLWSTCNLGAASPLEGGDYFAWAETKGTGAGKHDFSWETYAWCETSSLNASTLIINKYCDNIAYGIADHRLEIEREDDAASANWGSEWSIPSRKQIEELLSKKYTTVTWTQIANVPGALITSKSTGKSIFLPAAGCHYGQNVSDAGGYGGYWSSTLVRGRENGAYLLYVESKSNKCTNDLNRFCGRSIRPVTTRKK